MIDADPLDMETFGWILLVMAPVLAFGAASMLYNAIFASRPDDSQRTLDHRLNAAYLTWREWVAARGCVQPAFCPRTFDRGETCFAYERMACSYEPLMPHTTVDSNEPVFDTECGVPVGEGWSILDFFDGLRFVGKGALLVTNLNLYLWGGGGEIRIPLGDLRMVATSCSSFLIEAKSMDRPLIFTGVNGQMLRDTVYMLLGAG